jgi:hypothetical protein
MERLLNTPDQKLDNQACKKSRNVKIILNGCGNNAEVLVESQKHTVAVSPTAEAEGEEDFF